MSVVETGALVSQRGIVYARVRVVVPLYLCTCAIGLHQNFMKISMKIPVKDEFVKFHENMGGLGRV